jgi:microcystin-dependent protein
MANIQVKLRRGTEAEHDTTNGGFTGAEGEVTVDTTNDTLRVHDGTTAGGVRLAKLSEANVQSDWNETDTSSTAFILNKPSITAAPTGTVSAFAGSTAPTGYVLCDGAEYSETTESSLFAVIGSTYNTGGETANHFRVPDLGGRVIAGMGGSLLSGTDAVADTGGASTHTLSTAEMPSHSHSYQKPLYQAAVAGGPGVYSHTSTAADTTPTGNDQAHNNVQPTIILNYIIKT